MEQRERYATLPDWALLALYETWSAYGYELQSFSAWLADEAVMTTADKVRAKDVRARLRVELATPPAHAAGREE